MFELPDAQKIFTLVKEHAEKKQKSIVSDTTGLCRYRGANGAKCFAGVLIPEECYRVEFEGHTWEELVEHWGFPANYSKLIKTLQRVHDLKAPKDWDDALALVAKEFGLKNE